WSRFPRHLQTGLGTGALVAGRPAPLRRALIPGHLQCVSTGQPLAPAVSTMLLVSALWLATNRHRAGPVWCLAPRRLVPRPSTGRAGFGAGVIARHRRRA